MNFMRNSEELLAKAPGVVDSYCDGHWSLMCSLENEAKLFSVECSVDTFTRFLGKVAYLKQPREFRSQEEILPALKKHPKPISECVAQIPHIDTLDYVFLNFVGRIPYFGRGNCGRSFASAVGRLLRPDKFAIIDWRNLAVLSGCGEYAGLVDPTHHFRNLSCEEILKRKGSIPYSQELYIEYNDLVRLLASQEKKTPAEIDLILWTYSAEKNPFSRASKLSKPSLVTNSESEASSSLFFICVSQPIAKTPRHEVLNTIGVLVGEYLKLLKNNKVQSIPEIGRELVDIFKLVQREFHTYVRGQQRRRIQTLHIDEGLKAVIRSAETAQTEEDLTDILRIWVAWENKLKNDIDLPGSMVASGYLVLEHFERIRTHFSKQFGITLP